MQVMKRSSWLLVCSLLLAPAAMASPSPSPDEAELKRLSLQWMNAIAAKDKAVLESLLADNYVLQMPGDTQSQYVHRAQWLENAITMDWSGFRYENIVVDVHGDQATVSSRLFFKVSPNPLTFDSGVVDTWEKRAGKWQVSHRYLGESQLKIRIFFVLGFLTAALAALAAYVAWRLLGWSRRRAA